MPPADHEAAGVANVDSRLRATGRGERKHDSAGHVDAPVRVDSVVAGRKRIDKTAVDMEVASGVDAVVVALELQHAAVDREGIT